MFIRSERLFLRPGWPEDWQELLGRIDDKAVVMNLARTPWPYTADDARWFVDQPQDSRCPHFFVTLPTSMAPAAIIGCVGLTRGDAGVELGYWIAREHWGRGFATEAARATLSLARTLGHRRIAASHFLDNPASAKVLRKLGFQPTGQVVQRHSLARGTSAPAALHALDLGSPCDCDGNDDGRGGGQGEAVPAMRAA